MRNPFKRATPQQEANPHAMERQRDVVRNDDIEQATQEIEDYYDSLLYAGMPMQEAMRIERERDAAHAKIVRTVMEISSRGRQRR